jgi:hypothetical protein
LDSFFLCYARADQDFALRIATDLRAAGAPVWVDQFDIPPSQHWDRSVDAAVRGATGLLAILSPRSVASENVLDEISLAINSGKRIIPVLYEKCTLPLRLTRVQFIDATGDYAAALTRCTAAVIKRPAEGGLAAVEANAAALASELRARLDPDIVNRAIARLTPYVGPIASVLVQKAALRSVNEAELYAQVAGSIPEVKERQAFLKHVGPPSEGVLSVPETPRKQIDPTFLDRVAAVLVHYLGPLARHTVSSEWPFSPDHESLYQKLAARVPHAGQRAELLHKLRAL